MNEEELAELQASSELCPKICLNILQKFLRVSRAPSEYRVLSLEKFIESILKKIS